MPRTTAGLRSASATRLAEVARERPEWRTWVLLLEVASRAIQDDRRTLWVGLTSPVSPTARAPLLHHHTLAVNASAVRGLLQELIAALPPERLALASYRPSIAETLDILAAAIGHDSTALDALAIVHELEPGAFGAVAELAALCVLQQCGREIVPHIPPHWPDGYCPVCGAWPTLAERRGLDRSRRLRCGRCAADWEVPWLYCIYCGERNHNRLGSLATDARGEQDKVETCATCRGYLKSLPSLQGFSPLELLLHDLETVELDLVALDRDYRRPAANGFTLDLQVIDHASRPRL